MASVTCTKLTLLYSPFGRVRRIRTPILNVMELVHDEFVCSLRELIL